MLINFLKGFACSGKALFVYGYGARYEKQLAFD